VYDPPPLVDETEANERERSREGKHPFEQALSFKHTAVARSDPFKSKVTGESR